MSTDTYTPSDGQYRWKSIKDNENQAIQLLDPSMTHQELYISAQGINAEISNEFFITAYTKSPAPTGNPVIPDATLLPKIDGTKVTLTFTPARPQNVTQSNDTLFYTVLWANNDATAVMYSLCGVSYNDQVQGGPAHPGSASVADLVSGQMYKFNIFVEDGVTGGQSLYRQLGGIKISEPSGSPDNSLNLTLLLGIGLGVGVPSLLFLCYLFITCRRLTHQKEQLGVNSPTSGLDRKTGGRKDEPLLSSVIHSEAEVNPTQPQQAQHEPTPPVLTERDN